MKNMVRFAVAAAMLGSYGAAHAQLAPAPTAASADLWLFVADTTQGTAYARDTGITIDSLLPTADLGASTSLGSTEVLSTAISDSIDLTADSVLTNFLGTIKSGDTVEWAVEGTEAPNSTKPNKVGSLKGITSNDVAPLNTANTTISNLETWEDGFLDDYQNGFTTGGSAAGGAQKGGNGITGTFAAGCTTFTGGCGNFWGNSTGANAGSTDLYGQGADAAGVALGSESVLYGLTGSGSGGQNQSYILGNLELTAAGLLETVSSGGGSTVPLPAAVWLLGSGLLGLAGIGRRRSSAAA